MPYDCLAVNFTLPRYHGGGHSGLLPAVVAVDAGCQVCSGSRSYSRWKIKDLIRLMLACGKKEMENRIRTKQGITLLNESALY